MKLKPQLILLFIVCATAVWGQNPTGGASSVIQSSMIWSTGQPDGEQVYVAFRKTFDLAVTTAPAMLHLFADSRYMLWVNGKYVLRGPCRFNPVRPEYDVVDIGPYLLKCKNSIVVLAHNYGSAINGRILKHVPGLAAVPYFSGKEILLAD